MINAIHKDFYLKWSPRKVKGICIFLQDFNAKPSRYSGLAEVLCNNGILGIAPDILMPEVSEAGESVSSGSLTYIHRIIKDIYNDAVIKYTGIPVFLCGEGFGALIALRYAQFYPKHVQGLVLLSPFFQIPFSFPAKISMIKNYLIKPKALIELPLKLSMITKDQWYLDALMESESSRHYYSAQFLCNYWFTINAVKYHRKKIKTSILCLLAGDDLLAENEASHQFFDSLVLTDKRINYYNEFHALSVPVARDQIYNGISEWLIARSTY